MCSNVQTKFICAVIAYSYPLMYHHQQNELQQQHLTRNNLLVNRRLQGDIGSRLSRAVADSGGDAVETSKRVKALFCWEEFRTGMKVRIQNRGLEVNFVTVDIDQSYQEADVTVY